MAAPRVREPTQPMILEQIYLDCLSQASYLVGDEAAGVAAVVDPRRDVEVYLEQARRRGLAIRHVILTHVHADFVPGHLELRERCRASIHMGARAEVEFPFEPQADGSVLELGAVRLRFLETPGHTPESVCVLVSDGAAPRAVLTGDTLFLGDVGRPDLLVSAGTSAEELAGALYDSLREKLLPLPDDVVVYPGHGAGSACGKSLSKERSSTLGLQKRTNWALQPMEREAFVRALTAGLPAAPAYFAHDAALNRRERPTLDATLGSALRPLALDQALRLAATGALVLDVREPDEYARLHLRGSVNVGLSGRFASWIGTLVDRERTLVLVADPGREREAATRLGRIGFDRVAGYLDGGPAALGARPELTASHERVDPPALAERLAGLGAPLVLDVRAPSEYEAGHLRGSVNLPLPELEARAAEIPAGVPLVVQCQGGYRSSIAASLLERLGRPARSDLRGGFAAWQLAGLPVAAPAGGPSGGKG